MTQITIEEELSIEPQEDSLLEKYNLNYILTNKLEEEDILNIFKKNEEELINYITRYYKINKKTIEIYKDKIDWQIYSMNKYISKSMINKYPERINWYLLISNAVERNNLYRFYKVIHRNINHINFEGIVSKIKLDNDSIHELIDYFTYETLFKTQMHIGYYTIQWLKERYTL
jgi:hypothetical protein